VGAARPGTDAAGRSGPDRSLSGHRYRPASEDPLLILAMDHRLAVAAPAGGFAAVRG
jgi:hypothetical protein